MARGCQIQLRFRVALIAALVAAQLAVTVTPGNARGRMAQGFNATPKIIDVALNRSGVLHGQIATRDGAPAEATPIVLFKNGNAVARTDADEHGRFSFDQVQGGVYVLAAPSGGQVCRLWSPGTAPPAAAPQVLLVTETAVVRGQTFCPTSLYEWFETHPVLGYTAATAAIALPIILINLDDDDAS